MHSISRGLVRLLTMVLLAQFAHSQSGTTTATTDPAELQARQQAAMEMLHAMEPPEQFEERIRSFIVPVLAQMNAEQAKRGRKFSLDPQRMQRVMMEAMPYEEYVALLAEAYAKRLTLDELGQITSFYKSPAGQKFLLAEQQVFPETTVAMMPTMLSRIEKAMEKERLATPEPTRPTQQ
jgi:hypothetical protein